MKRSPSVDQRDVNSRLAVATRTSSDCEATRIGLREEELSGNVALELLPARGQHDAVTTGEIREDDNLLPQVVAQRLPGMPQWRRKYSVSCVLLPLEEDILTSDCVNKIAHF